MRTIRACAFGAAVVVWLATISANLIDAQTSGESGASLSLALTGDTIITRPLSPHKDPEFRKVFDLIRRQDAAFTNLEISLHDYETYPMVESGGLHTRADPSIAKELVWAGLRLVSFANNHATDWGVEGMRLTKKHAEAAGLVVAGVGESLAAAREARFLETANGRMAMVATASTLTTNARAGDSRGDIPARPGVSPLRFTTTNIVTATGMSALRAIAGELGVSLPQGERVTFMGDTFSVGEQPGRQTSPNQADVMQMIAAVRNASRLADLTIVSIHAHEGDRNEYVPAQFLVTFARAMIDAGADVIVGHGPHVLRGIELYKGKPIFYSLGNFIFENETIQRLPSDDFESLGLGLTSGVADLMDRRTDNDRSGFPTQREWWESVVAIPRWDNRTLKEIELHPISLGFGKPRLFRGRPMLADQDLGRKIIGDLQRLSEPFRTKIEYRNGLGIIIPASGQQ